MALQIGRHGDSQLCQAFPILLKLNYNVLFQLHFSLTTQPGATRLLTKRVIDNEIASCPLHDLPFNLPRPSRAISSIQHRRHSCWFTPHSDVDVFAQRHRQISQQAVRN